MDNDVHVIGISSLAGGHLTLVPQLKQALVKRGRGNILVIAGRRHPAAGLRRSSTPTVSTLSLGLER